MGGRTLLRGGKLAASGDAELSTIIWPITIFFPTIPRSQENQKNQTFADTSRVIDPSCLALSAGKLPQVSSSRIDACCAAAGAAALVGETGGALPDDDAAEDDERAHSSASAIAAAADVRRLMFVLLA